jgi:hypothetical protein
MFREKGRRVEGRAVQEPVKRVLGIDQWIIEQAERSEEAAIIDGKTEEGLPVLVLVVTGANVGLFKQEARRILPGLVHPDR